MKKSLLPWISGLITFITVALYVAVLFINGIIFAAEQQPIVVFISGITVFSIFANMVSYWSLTEQTTLESEEIKDEEKEYDDYVRDNITDTFDFERTINEQYNANKRLQHKEHLLKEMLGRNLLLKHYNSRINRLLPKIKFIEMSKHYKNKEKALLKLNTSLSNFNIKKEMREQILDMRATTRSIHYKRVSPQSIFSRNGDTKYFANGVNKLGKHKSSFMITRVIFSGITTFFPILFVFSINGIINTAYIIPIAFGLGAVLITILQTIMFAKKYTKYDTLDYLNDLFYICKWYVSYKASIKTKEQPKEKVIILNPILDNAQSSIIPCNSKPNLNDELIAKN